MIISLALLGYGASGTFISIFRNKILSNFKIFFISCIVLFGFCTILCFVIAQQIHFNVQEIFWDKKSFYILLSYFLLFTLPFFFAASAVGSALSYYKNDISKLYASDMLGAGIGSIVLLFSLFIFYPELVLQIVSSVIFFTTSVAAYELGIKNKKIFLFLFLLFLPFVIPEKFIKPQISEYKSLSQTLQVNGTDIIEQRSSPLGKIDVVQSVKIPFRYAPGLSLYSNTVPKEQLGIFTNGEGMSVITKFPDSIKDLSYFDYLTSAAAYHLGKINSALIIGTGGGGDILQAIYHNTDYIDGVEMNPQIVDLLKGRFSNYSGEIYYRDNISIHISEARGFLKQNSKKYDLIQFAMVDSYGASSAGLYALNENYLYTVEAFKEYMNDLSQNGYLSISRWIKIPPRDSIKLFATAFEALRQNNIADPRKSIILIRNWQTSTLIVKNGIFSQNEIINLKEFCQSRGFDVVYYPGISKDDANKTNILKEAYFFDAVDSIIDSDDDFFKEYKFFVEPSTDDKPYFNHFFKWKTFNEIISLKESGGFGLMEWGYIVLIICLAIALIISFIFIMLPLIMSDKIKKVSDSTSFSKTKIVLYFFALGIAFLFLEIAFMQKFILFLSNPIYSAAIIISSFLIFAGLGSQYSKQMIDKNGHLKSIKIAISCIFFAGIFYLIMLDIIFDHFISFAFIAKVILTIILIAPIAFFMGIPFPAALSRLGKVSPDLIPLAWGVNGYASVISAILATLLAIHFGFTVVTILSIFFYIAAVMIFPNDAQPAAR